MWLTRGTSTVINQKVSISSFIPRPLSLVRVRAQVVRVGSWSSCCYLLYLAFTRYCFTSRLYCYCTIIFFANTPSIVQYIAQYYQLNSVIAPPRPILRGVFQVFGGVWRYFFVSFSGRILDGWRCLNKNCSQHGKGGIIAHYCNKLLCNTPLPAPLYCLEYCAIHFPHDPLYCNKILAISCKEGQAAICCYVSIYMCICTIKLF